MSNLTVIKVDKLNKEYSFKNKAKEKLYAIKNLSFEINEGETVAIFGANGSGKSTLLKIIAGITKPTSGRVIIKGKVASILDIGAGFHPELSGRENIFLNGQIQGFTKKEISAKFAEIVEFSGISHFINEPVKNYSNGMFLRLAFSIIVHLDFDVYLFDEVLTVGDHNFQLEVNKKIHDLIKLKKTVLVVSHNISDFSSFTKFIWLKSGELVNYTTKKNILMDYFFENDNTFTLHTKNRIEITNFSEFSISKELEVVKISLYQNTINFLQSDYSTFVRIEFKKLNSEGTIEPSFSFSDNFGNIIFTSAPFILGVEDVTMKGNYIYECEIPPYFLGLKPYFLNIYFLHNLFKNDQKDNSNDEQTVLNSVHRLEKLIGFKVAFKSAKYSNDLSNLNLDGGIIPALNWKLIS